MLVWDRAKGEIIDASTGEVVEEKLIDHGPEWRSYRPERRRCHVMYRRDPEALRLFRGLVPRYVYEDAGNIMRRLGLGGRAAALAAIIYSCKRHGVPVPAELARLINTDRKAVHRTYRRIVETLGAPERTDDAAMAQVAGLAVKLGRPQLAITAVKLYRTLRKKHQGHRPTTLAAVALVKTGFKISLVSRHLGVPPSTISKALKHVEAQEK